MHNSINTSQMRSMKNELTNAQFFDTEQNSFNCTVQQQQNAVEALYLCEPFERCVWFFFLEHNTNSNRNGTILFYNKN